MSDSEFLSLTEAAGMAGISTGVLRRLAEAGTVSWSEVPGDPRRRKLFRRTDIEALRAKIEQGFEVASSNPPKRARKPRGLVSDEEKERWAAREYPSRGLDTV